MYTILYLTVSLAIGYATENTSSLRQLEGPWTIRNASENALPIIGKCPSMKIHSNTTNSSDHGTVLLKTNARTFRLDVISVDQKVYQVFIRLSDRSFKLGNVTILHVEKSTFFITEFQTEDQAYYAILTKSGKPSQDTYKKIEKTWKSATPSKSVPLVPVERENCSEEDKNSESNETEDETTITETFKELSTQQSSTSVDHEKSLNGSSTIKSTKEEKPRESVNTTNISEETTSSTLIPALSSHLTESSAIVGKNNTGKPNMRTKSGTIMISSSFLTVMSFILFLIINV